MAAGAPAGASLVFLTGAETRLEVSAWERGLELQWRAGGWSDSYTHEEVAGRQWSPERLTVSWSGGDIALSWIRMARAGGDSWGAGEVPLDVPEAYLVQVSGGESVREWAVASWSALYPTADQVVDFPGGGLAIISVAQLGRYGEPGAWSTISVAIPAP